MSWKEDLADMAPPPTGSMADVLWEPVETSLGVSVPQDYKDFVQIWRPLQSLNFIWFFLPESKKPAVRFDAAVEGFVDSYSWLQGSHPDAYGLPILPEAGAMLPFAVTDNGDYLGWIVGDEEPAVWTVCVLASEDGMPTRYDMGFGDFLVSLFSRKIEVDGVPAKLLDRGPLIVSAQG